MTDEGVAEVESVPNGHDKPCDAHMDDEGGRGPGGGTNGVGWWVSGILASFIVAMMLTMFGERRNELTRQDVEAITRVIVDDKLAATTARVENVTTRLEAVSHRVDDIGQNFAQLVGEMKHVLQGDQEDRRR